MSGRIVMREGAISADAFDAILEARCDAADPEVSLRATFRASLDAARDRGCGSVAAPALGAGRDGVSIQRCAEILFEEARRHLAGETSIEEISFVVEGEPAFRVFESVQDAARIAEQIERLRQRS
jgi:O-acetyl-ADP-ribose deacetylase (regulator of RNase III)